MTQTHKGSGQIPTPNKNQCLHRWGQAFIATMQHVQICKLSTYSKHNMDITCGTIILFILEENSVWGTTDLIRPHRPSQICATALRKQIRTIQSDTQSSEQHNSMCKLHKSKQCNPKEAIQRTRSCPKIPKKWQPSLCLVWSYIVKCCFTYSICHLQKFPVIFEICFHILHTVYVFLQINVYVCSWPGRARCSESWIWFFIGFDLLILHKVKV